MAGDRGDDGPATPPSKAAFFTTLPGILTGVAALISAVVGAVALTAGGNGDPGKGGSAPTTTLDTTKASWARSASAICTDFNAEFAALRQPQDPEELGGFIETVVGIANRGLARFRVLEPPTGQEATVERMISLLERALASYTSAFSSLGSGDLATAERLIADGDLSNERASEIARQLGAHACDAP